MGAIECKSSRHAPAYNSYGNIYLNIFNKKTFFPGEKVQGTIFLNLKADYPGHSLYLHLKGHEVIDSISTSKVPKETNTYVSPSSDYESPNKQGRKDAIIRSEDGLKTIYKHLNVTLVVFE